MWILLSSTQISLGLSLLISAGAGRESAGAGRGSARRGSLRPSSAPALVRPVHTLPVRPRSMCAARESVGAGALAGRGARGTGRIRGARESARAGSGARG